MTETQAQNLLEVLAHPLLEECFQKLQSGEDSIKLRAILEREFEPSTCLAILDCLTCRVRYESKFHQAHDWLLTRSAAEQATGSRIAVWRSLYLAGLSPARELTELGCGIGGDSVFLSREFQVTAYEQDPARALLARSNLRELGGATKSSVSSRVTECESLVGEILFCDPARRSDSRISHPEEWLPPLSRVMDCYLQGRFKTVAIKCAPGLQVREITCPNHPLSVSFISLDGELKECLLVLTEAQASQRAILLGRKGEEMVLESNGVEIPVLAPQAGLFLHNPDPAILRAEALDSLAHQLQAGIVHPKIAYLVGPHPCSTPAAQSFEIIDHLALNWSALKKRMSSTQWSEYEYLGRGVPFSQLDVRKRLPKLKKKSGTESERGSLIIYRENEGYRAVLGKRV